MLVAIPQVVPAPRCCPHHDRDLPWDAVHFSRTDAAIDSALDSVSAGVQRLATLQAATSHELAGQAVALDLVSGGLPVVTESVRRCARAARDGGGEEGEASTCVKWRRIVLCVLCVVASAAVAAVLLLVFLRP